MPKPKINKFHGDPSREGYEAQHPEGGAGGGGEGPPVSRELRQQSDGIESDAARARHRVKEAPIKDPAKKQRFHDLSIESTGLNDRIFKAFKAGKSEKEVRPLLEKQRAKVDEMLRIERDNRAVPSEAGTGRSGRMGTRIGGVAGRPELHAEGEFVLFTAEPEGEVTLPDGSTRKAWTRKRLLQVAENFGPDGRIAREAPHLAIDNPIVIGHDEDLEFMKRTDTPSAGWIKSLDVKGDNLVATFRDMPDKVVGWVQNQTFPKRSAEFYPDYHGFGPTLRRVALLGGEIPAKKDLGDTVFFAEAEPAYEQVAQFNEGGPRMPVPMRKPEHEEYAGLGAVLSKLTQEPERRSALIQRVMKATEAPEASVLAWAEDEDSIPEDKRDAVRAALTDDEPPAEDDAAPAEGEEDEDMEKDKKPPVAKAGETAGAGAPTPAAAAFSEQQEARLRGLEDRISATTRANAKLREQLASVQARADRAERKAHEADIDAFCESLNKQGKATGATLGKIKSHLRRIEDVEKFAEGETIASATRQLLADVLPKVDGSRIVSRDAKTESDEPDDVRELREDFAEWKRIQPHSDLSIEKYAEGAGWKPEQVARLKPKTEEPKKS